MERTNKTAKMTSGQPEICAAFVTVKRESKQYVDVAIGSLLEGLTEDEREMLYIHVLFANTDPTIHPSWGKSWLRGVVDSVESYVVSDEVLQHLRTLEMERNWREKGVL
jgi:hypothetical protein